MNIITVEIERIVYTPSEEEDNHNTIKRLDSNTHYDVFFNNFMLPNKPCLISNIANSWECYSNWSTPEGKINTTYFDKTYGHLLAPVANCSKLQYNSQVKSNMLVSDYMDYISNDSKTELLYLKDWHLRRTYPELKFYTVPLFFASDWLNEYALDNEEDDFMFVYLGPENTWTPFHVDVYNSFSWSVNIVGRKKWLFFPPGEEVKLIDNYSNFPLDVEPKLIQGVKYYEVIQEQGDAIFVPSGWHHQVKNIKDTISINHNWVNGCNIQCVWESMKSNLNHVEKELCEFSEDEDFYDQCQKMLKALYGMDHAMFIKFVKHIAIKRLKQLGGESSFQLFEIYEFGLNHIHFDLLALKSIFNSILKDSIMNKDPEIKEIYDKIV